MSLCTQIDEGWCRRLKQLLHGYVAVFVLGESVQLSLELFLLCSWGSVY